MIFGIIIEVIEDLVAVKLATEAALTFRIVGIVILITIPFVILGELVVDKIDLLKFLGGYQKADSGIQYPHITGA